MTVLAIRHVPYEGMGLLEKVFEESRIPFQYADAWTDESLPRDLNGYRALVVMGGPMSVYEADGHPFLYQEIELIREALQKKIPMLGICLGSQLLAKAAGAEVVRGPSKEIGWFPLRLRPEAKEDLLLQHLPDEVMMFHWHGDTFYLPKEAHHLASSEKYRHQAFRMGDSAWGFQFHCEVSEAMVKEWVQKFESDLMRVLPDWNSCEVLSQTACFLPEMEKAARKVLGAFASITLQRQKA